MTKRNRRTHSPAFKAKVALAALKGDETLAELAQTRVFAPARIALLRLLASQAATSLENTRLYRELEQREAKIRRLVDANIIGIFIWDLQGHVLEANDAFLRVVGYDREDLDGGPATLDGPHATGMASP